MRENEKTHELLIKKAAQVRSGADILLARTTDWQIIRQYLSNRHDDLELTLVQQDKLNRYQYIYNQLVSGKYTEAEIIPHLVKLYKVKQSQAYEDLNCSKELFATVFNINKKFELANEISIAKAARRKCEDMNDFANARGYGKLIKELISELPDEEETPGLDFEGHTIEAVFDPRLLGASHDEVDMVEVMKAINAKRSVPINTDLFEKIPYQETPNDAL